jgi:hypothetical protein
MPNRMPRLDLRMERQASVALGLVRAGEFAWRAGTPSVRRRWSTARLEALYEIVFLQVFSAWERCQEEIFLRSLCGYASISAGQELLVKGKYFTSVAIARNTLLPTGAYWLWHEPDKVIGRCHGYISGGRQEAVILSSKPQLKDWSAIRHRIAHDQQEDAKNKFSQAINNISGRPYIAPRPGRFLRDIASSSTNRRWIDVAISELVGLAKQLV